jgi:small subunit ribosomal protein S2
LSKELARELINAGVHYGHGVSRWNPKMKPYIFGKRGTIHIINVKETIKGLLIAKKLLSDVVASGKDVVFVGTKRQAQKAVKEAAEKSGMHSVITRWLGGTLTNFRTIRTRLGRLEELEGMETSGTMDAESKKMASQLRRELKKIKSNLDGIRKMSRLPGVIVVVDCKKEHLALAEAKKLGVPTIGIIDTDSDPDSVDVAIPANDDSIRAVDILLSEMADAVAAAKASVVMMQKDPEQMNPARPRSKRPTLARAESEEGAAPAEPTGETAAQ